jgi:hypothetical protein
MRLKVLKDVQASLTKKYKFGVGQLFDRLSSPSRKYKPPFSPKKLIEQLLEDLKPAATSTWMYDRLTNPVNDFSIKAGLMTAYKPAESKAPMKVPEQFILVPQETCAIDPK